MEKKCYNLLKINKNKLSKQQINTFKGQIKAKDFNGFLKGINKLLNLI